MKRSAAPAAAIFEPVIEQPGGRQVMQHMGSEAADGALPTVISTSCSALPDVDQARIPAGLAKRASATVTDKP